MINEVIRLSMPKSVWMHLINTLTEINEHAIFISENCEDIDIFNKCEKISSKSCAMHDILLNRLDIEELK